MGRAPAVRPCPECGEPVGGRYEWEGRRLCWLCLPAGVRRAPPRRRERLPRTPYSELVEHVWTRLEMRTEMPVFSLSDGTGRLLSYCPACRIGTLVVQLLDTPGGEPQWTATSSAGHGCSYGCTFAQIEEALRDD